MDPPPPLSTSPNMPLTPERPRSSVTGTKPAELTSTPPTNGTASQAKINVGGRLPDVVNGFQRDLLQRSTDAPFVNFLLFFLRCTNPELVDDAALQSKLNELMDLAVCMCHNSDPSARPLRKSGSNNRKAETLRDDWQKHMDQYAQAKIEQDLYAPFIQLANSILQALDTPKYKKRLEELALSRRCKYDERILFQQNDPAIIATQYSGINGEPLLEDVHRKPDVAVLSLHDACQTHSQDSALNTLNEWTSRFHYLTAKGGALKKPHPPPSFLRVKMCFEFKKKTGKMSQPSTSVYKKKLEPTRIDPQSVDGRADLPVPWSNPPTSVMQSAQSGHPSSSTTNEVQPTRKSERVASRSAHSTIQPFSSSGSKKRSREGNARSVHSNGKRAKIEGMGSNTAVDSVNHITTADGSETSTKVDGVSHEKLPGPLQSAIYAGGKLCASPALQHTINAVVEDNHLWLWWYDRGGAIQSHGLDFFEDLPYFVALLAILDHFTEENFGLHPAFTLPENAGKTQTMWNLALKGERTSDPSTCFTLDIDPFDNRMNYGLFGRNTVVLPVTSSSDNPLKPGTKLSNMDMVAKMYHPEQSRANEVDLLNIAHYLAGHAPADDRKFITGHLPLTVASRSWSNRYSKNMTSVLKPRQPEKIIRRCLRIVVFFKLRPIHELEGHEFIKAFMECSNCHWKLWEYGLYHRDVSSYNMMYYRTSTGQVIGVLIDLDLSTLAELQQKPSLDRTGNLISMAQKLHQVMAARKPTPFLHIYEHDAESQYYVLAWVTSIYNGSKARNWNIYREWFESSHPLDIAQAKSQCVKNSGLIIVTQAHQTASNLIKDFAVIIRDCLTQQTNKENTFDNAKEAVERAKDNLEKAEKALHDSTQPMDKRILESRVDSMKARSVTANKTLDDLNTAQLWPQNLKHPREINKRIYDMFLGYWEEYRTYSNYDEINGDLSLLTLVVFVKSDYPIDPMEDDEMRRNASAAARRDLWEEHKREKALRTDNDRSRGKEEGAAEGKTDDTAEGDRKEPNIPFLFVERILEREKQVQQV